MKRWVFADPFPKDWKLMDRLFVTTHTLSTISSNQIAQYSEQNKSDLKTKFTQLLSTG